MADDAPRTLRRGWLKRLQQQMSGEPQDREALLEDLREATERGLLDPEALEMLEGVIAVVVVVVASTTGSGAATG